MTVMDIESFRVLNYKSIDDSGMMEMGDLNILIGKNDAGKSALLEGLRKFLDEDKPSADHFHQHEKEEAQEIVFTAKFSGVPTELKDKISDRHEVDGDNLTIKRKFKNKGNSRPSDNTFVNGEKVKKGTIKKGDNRLTMAKSRNFIYNYIPEPIWIPAERDVTEETKLKGGTVMNDLLAPILKKGEYRETDTLQEKITELEDSLTGTANQVSQDLTEKMKTHMSAVTDINIKTGSVNLSKAVKPEVTIEDQYLDKEIKVSDRGSGVGSLLILSLMETYVEMEVGEGYCLLFEEPGNFLHPAAERRMLSALQKIANRGQVGISTHSQIMIDRGDSARMHVVRRNDGKTNFEHVEENAFVAIDEIGAKNSDILQSDFVIYVEGPTELKVVEEIARCSIEDWESHNITIQHLGGTGNIVHCDPETLSNINRNFAILLDSDKKKASDDPSPEAEQIKEECERIDKRCKILEKRAIENYYSAEAISATCGITADRDFVSDYDDMAYRIGAKIANERIPDDKVDEGNEGKYFDKVGKGKEIIQDMYERGEEIEEIEEFLKSCIADIPSH